MRNTRSFASLHASVTDDSLAVAREFPRPLKATPGSFQRDQACWLGTRSALRFSYSVTKYSHRRLTPPSFILCGIRESNSCLNRGNELVWETNSSVADMVRDTRIELVPQPWEGRVLPLNQSRTMFATGVLPLNQFRFYKPNFPSNFLHHDSCGVLVATFGGTTIITLSPGFATP